MQKQKIRIRLKDIVDPTDKTVDALMKLDLPAGVDVESSCSNSRRLPACDQPSPGPVSTGRGLVLSVLHDPGLHPGNPSSYTRQLSRVGSRLLGVRA